MSQMETTKIQWYLKSFKDLNGIDVYNILNIRNTVFVEGQQAVYLDTDFKDLDALHLMGFVSDKLVAYCRLFDENVYYDGYSSIGRVSVLSEFRGLGMGKLLLYKAIDVLQMRNQKIAKIAAQAYLENFYSSFGFQKISEIYILDGIEHIDMKLKL